MFNSYSQVPFGHRVFGCNQRNQVMNRTPTTKNARLTHVIGPQTLSGRNPRNPDNARNSRPALRTVGEPDDILGWILCMDKILHHFETMEGHCSLVLTGKSAFQGCLGSAKWISPIHSMLGFLLARRQRVIKKWFETFDSDQNGRVDLEERARRSNLCRAP